MKLRYRFEIKEGLIFYKVIGKVEKYFGVHTSIYSNTLIDVWGPFVKFGKRDSPHSYLNQVKSSRVIFGKIENSKIECAKCIIARKLDKIVEKEIEKEKRREYKKEIINNCIKRTLNRE